MTPHDFPIFWLLNPHVFLVNMVALMGETMAKLDGLEPAMLASSWLANPLQHKSNVGLLSCKLAYNRIQLLTYPSIYI
jgi:hypothetical protein